MPRGGKRPGAGAPKGNMNALKHGLRSKQFAKIGALIAESPDARAALLALAERWDLSKGKADEVATVILAQMVTRGLARGEDRLRPGRQRLIVLPAVQDRRSNRNAPAPPVSEPPALQHETGGPFLNSVPINQKTATNPANNQPAGTESG